MPDLRDRLQKQDVEIILDTLRAAGLRVSAEDGRVAIWDHDRWVGSLYWMSATKSMPGHWSLYVGVLPVCTVGDLKKAGSELQRVEKWYTRAMASWKNFQASRSNKRWMVFQGMLAALLLRQDDPESP